jgi:predicted ATPase
MLLVRLFDLLAHGRRTSPVRQTLRATLEWSYELLSEDEGRVLRRRHRQGACCERHRRLQIDAPRRSQNLCGSTAHRRLI